MGNAPKFEKIFGQKYIKIITKAPGTGSAFAFIDNNGNIYKPAGFKVPAKGIRGNVYDEKLPLTAGYLYR